MPPVSRFGGGSRAAKKQTIIDKLKAFFERFFGIGDSSFAKKEEPVKYYDFSPDTTTAQKAAAPAVEYRKQSESTSIG